MGLSEAGQRTDEHRPEHSSTDVDPSCMEGNETINDVADGEPHLTKRHSYLSAPPYWARKRSATYSTVASDHGPAITLKDNTDEPQSSHNQLWARSITISDYVIVQGNSLGIGAYVVWTCRVDTLDGSPMIIRKRYSEFDELRNRLLRAFPESSLDSLPALPPKSAVYKFKPKFLEKRRQGLDYFLNCVMLSPQFASSVVVKAFIFPQET